MCFESQGQSLLRKEGQRRVNDLLVFTASDIFVWVFSCWANVRDLRKPLIIHIAICVSINMNIYIYVYTYNFVCSHVFKVPGGTVPF